MVAPKRPLVFYFFSIVLGAEYSFDVKSIATYAYNFIDEEFDVQGFGDYEYDDYEDYDETDYGDFEGRVSVQGDKSLGGHFACFCQEFNFYEVKKGDYFSKRKGKYFYTFNHFL